MHSACIMISPFLASVRAYNAWNPRETVTIRHSKFSVNTPDVEVYTRVAINFLILSEGDHASQAERRASFPFFSFLFFFFLFFLLPLYFFFPPPFQFFATMHTSGVNPCRFSHGLCIAGKCKWKWGKKTNCNLFIYAGPG